MSHHLGGFVTTPNIYVTNKRTLEFDEDGLFSQRIFGPVNGFRCKCGKLAIKNLDSGKTCPSCNVICETNELRLSTFGKIKLVFPVVKPTKIKHFYKITGKQYEQILRPDSYDVNSSSQRYLAISGDAETLKITESIQNENNFFTIPFRITGIYSFILALKFVAFKLKLNVAKQYFDNKYIVDVLSVIPPDIRPTYVEMQNNKMEKRLTPVNVSYQHILNLNKHFGLFSTNLETDEADWLDRIQYSFVNQLLDQDVIDSTILEFDSLSARYQFYVNEIYDFANDIISGKEGLIRSSILGKTIEFSARAVIVSDPGIKPYQVRVGKKILFKLWQPYFLHYLTTIKNEEFDKCYNHIRSKTYEEIKEEFDEFLVWFENCGGCEWKEPKIIES